MSARARFVVRGNGSRDRHLWMFCPGCDTHHALEVRVTDGSRPSWAWNGSEDLPTLQPSVLVGPNTPRSRCHFYVTDGRIQFLNDCWHDLKGQTVDLPPIADSFD